MVQNLAEQSFVAQRIICDHVKCWWHSQCYIANVTCSKELLISATSARQRYQAHLDDMKKERESVKVNERKRTLTRDITEVEGQKKRKTLMLLFNRQIIMLKELKAVVT